MSGGRHAPSPTSPGDTIQSNEWLKPDVATDSWRKIGQLTRRRAASRHLELSCSRAFDQPIPLPDGRELVTLEDAGNYITKLPKAEHDSPEWQAAMEAFILVGTSGGIQHS